MRPASIREATVGSSALNRWSFILLTPLGIAAYFASNVQATLRLNVIHLVAILGGELIALLVGLLAWATVLSPKRSTRSLALTLIVFAIIGAVRGAGIDAILLGLGEPSPYSTFGRVLLSAIITTVGLVFVSIATNLNRTAKRSLKSLRSARRHIDETTLLAERSRALLVTETIARVQQALNRAVHSMPEQPELDASSAANALEQLSAKVIRPMSHALVSSPALSEPKPFSAIPSSDESPPLIDLEGISEPEIRLHSVLTYPSGLTVFVITSPVVALFLLGGIGIANGIGVTITSLATLAATCALASKLTRTNGVLRRASFMHVLAIYGLVGALTVGAATIQFWLQAGTLLPGWFGVVMIAAVAIGLSLAKAHFAVQHQLENALTDALRHASDASIEAQRLVDIERDRLAKLVHADVQGELIATAWKIRREAMSPENLTEELARLTNSLTGLLQREPASEIEIPELQVERLIRVWQSAIPIEFEVSSEAWQQLRQSTGQVNVVLDVLSEALTNAVRHGKPGEIRVELYTGETGRLILTVTNLGELNESAAPGSLEVKTPSASMGMQRIRKQARTATLSARDGYVMLVVEFAD